MLLPDRYDRTARLYPAVLSLFPPLWTASVIVTFDLRAASLGTSLIGSSVVMLAGATLLMNVARSAGKGVEPRFAETWGGLPSTAFLRHRDGTIDSVTKARYHAKLTELCDGLVLPKQGAEQRDQARADEKYGSAIKKLIELRRDDKWNLVHSENAQYGFRRNLLGLKRIAMGSALLALTGTLLAWYLSSSQPITAEGIRADTHARWPIYSAAIANVAYVVLYQVVVTEAFVRQAATGYAKALLRTLDTP